MDDDPNLPLAVQAAIEREREAILSHAHATYLLIFQSNLARSLQSSEPMAFIKKPASLKLELQEYSSALFDAEAKHYVKLARSEIELRSHLKALAVRIVDCALRQIAKHAAAHDFHCSVEERSVAIEDGLNQRIETWIAAFNAENPAGSMAPEAPINSVGSRVSRVTTDTPTPPPSEAALTPAKTIGELLDNGRLEPDVSHEEHVGGFRSNSTPHIAFVNARRDLLEQFAVPAMQGVFVLGCFARHATIYSQQIRALNLIYALNEEFGLAENCVAIVGAGIAGLTAAAAALILGAEVTLLEKQPSPLTLQKGNSKRWLHPHIYDWPFTDEPDRDARLPILNWTASISEQVATNLGKEWGAIAKRFEGFLDFQLSIADLTLSAGAAGNPVLHWSGKQKRGFSFVIFAVGFGLEGTAPRDSYWSPDDIDADLGPPEQCLVSGYGDGALTDLIRLCVRDFRQDEVIDLFANMGATPSVKHRIRQIESNVRRADDEWLTQQYQSFNLRELQDFLRSKRRTNRTVFLAGRTPWRYSGRSSSLNKFIVSQLERVGAFTPLACGPWLKYEPSVMGGGRVTWSDGSVISYDRVVLRHGPAPSLQRDVWDRCEALRIRWAATSSHADLTRKPIWPSGYWEGKDRSVALSWALQRARPVATSMIDRVSKTMANPKYKEDLARLDERWKLDAVLSKKTVIMVVGSTAACELLDRPVAEYLRDLIDDAGSKLGSYHRAVVFSDVIWDKSASLKGFPLISVGGPNGNAVTKLLLDSKETHREHREWEMGEGARGYFQELEKGCPQVALYGNSAARTRKAVETYIEKQEGLQSFLDMCWGADRK